MRCAQLGPIPDLDTERQQGRRYGLAVAGIAAAWLSAVALIGPLLVTREIDASRDAAARGDVGAAIEHASSARSIEPWAASPYVQLGLLAELQGDYASAAAHYSDAIEREDRNWQWYYLRANVERAAGDETGAQRDLERARELNPLAACLASGSGDCG